jgi:propane monooxygenase small subunit
MFELLTTDREFADHNKQILDQWLATWTARAINAARTLQPIWSQPDSKPPRFEDGLDAAKNRFAAVVTELHIDVPKELSQ